MKILGKLALGALLLMPGLANALQLPDIFSSNMVLQQNSNVAMWGWADPSSKVTVETSWNGKTYTAYADRTGRWDVRVATPAASYTPYNIIVKDDGMTVDLDNVLIGEVWFASGQSNMEMPLRGFWGAPVEGAQKAIAESGKYKKAIRFVTVPKVEALVPQDSVGGKWVECEPANAPEFSAAGYFFARQLNDIIDVPVGVINCSWGGSKLEGWLPEDILKNYPDVKISDASNPEVGQYSKPMIMYNGMLHPLAGYTVKGFLWNQGESNVGQDSCYAERFATMINLWRDMWSEPDAPVYLVEIPPYISGDEQGTWSAKLREAQQRIPSILPHSGVVCSSDLATDGMSYQIHPAKKQEVGERLAYLAAVNDYGVKGIECQSPTFKSMEVKGNEAILTFDNANDGFTPEKEMQGFEVAGADRVFYPAHAEAVYTDRPRIKVTSDKVDDIVAVRYCFKNWATGKVWSMRGLPIVPFRTDNW